VGFLRKNGAFTFFMFPHATSTRFLGVTAHDYIVGSYVDKLGLTHGFLLTSPLFQRNMAWASIDDPDGIGTTVVTSVNIHKNIAGYYVDVLGKTHGFIATPASSK
jgi:hypothetical protein